MIQSVRLVDFRCFTTASYTFEADAVFLIGANAQGKTSLLESIAVAARLQSPRASKQSQTVRVGANGFGVSMNWMEKQFKAVYQDRKFSLACDGQVMKRKEYLAETPKVVWIENRDMDLVRGSGERRRKYLDFLCSQLSHEYAQSLRAYTKALRNRNVLLKEQQSRTSQFQVFTELLEVHGQKLIDLRKETVGHLVPLIRQHHATISQGYEEVNIQYDSSFSAPDLSTALDEQFAQDVIMKQTLCGPHRDDLSLTIFQQPAAEYASEGQQRTLALALKLAQGSLLMQQPETHVLYLIDDVFGELDPNRRSALFSTLPRSAQKLITTTEMNWELPIDHQQIITINRE